MSAPPLRLFMVDDEPLARARARRVLAELGGAVVVGEAGTADEAVPQIERLRPDVLLLDVQMPGADGFELLQRLAERPAVIFVTAYDQHAVRAFEEHAVDYLLKPYRRERLAEALDRARAQLARPEELSRRLQELLATLPRGGETAPVGLERFTVRVGQRQRILRAAEVLWFAAEEKLVVAVTADGRHYVNFTLDELERRLDPARFVRVHRSAIANLDHAVALHPGFAGTWRLQMDDAARSEVPVARARARALRERLGA